MKFDPDRMRALFEEIPPPDSLDRWRVEPRAHLRPRRPVAMAAAASVLVVTLVTAGFIALLSDLSGTEREPTPSMTSTEPSRAATPPPAPPIP